MDNRVETLGEFFLQQCQVYIGFFFVTAYAWSMHGGEKTRTKRHSTASDNYTRSHLVFPVLCSLAVLGYSSPAPVHNHPGFGFIDSTRQPRVSELPNTS